jgi:hypothetical protein
MIFVIECNIKKISFVPIGTAQDTASDIRNLHKFIS